MKRGDAMSRRSQDLIVVDASARGVDALRGRLPIQARKRSG